MKKVLFVDCCIRREASRSKELAEYFIQKLEETGAYEIERLCLMDENLSYFSDGFFFQREALLAEGKFDHPRFRYAHRFAAADKIVIAAPFWDLSFPALLYNKIPVKGKKTSAWMVLPFIRMKRGCMGFVRQTTWFS